MSAGLALYRGGTFLLTPFARAYLGLRARSGREEASRLRERFGRAGLVRPNEPLLWLHGASLGETLALLLLIDELRRRDCAVLVTTGTRTSAGLLRERLPSGAFHQYAPLDFPHAVEGFLAHWQPNMLLLAESEIWPNVFRACGTQRIPVALINGRMSARSFARWRRVPKTARALFGDLAACVTQSPEQAQRFATLGARHVAVAGNLKFDAAPPPVDRAELARWRAALGSRPTIVMASTHAGDEMLAFETHKRLRDTIPGLVTVVVPRHPDRGAEIGALAEQRGLTAAMRSTGAPIGPDTNVLVADTIGEMGLWLDLASVAVIGKTFGDGGGQTPVEAALCGVPILHGPSTTHFAEAFAALDRDGGARRITAASLAMEARALLDDPAQRQAMGKAAAKTIASLAGGTARTLKLLEPLLAAALLRTPKP